MKGKLIFVLVTMLVFSIVGGNALFAKDTAGAPKVPDQPTSPTGPVETPNLKNQGITVNSIPFTEVKNLNQMPKPVQEMVKNHRKEAGYDFWSSDEGIYYLAIFAGEKPTGGYGIDVVEIEDNEGMTNVLVKKHSPKKGAMVTMAITYPYTVVKFTGTTDQFRVQLTTGQIMSPDGTLTDLIECNTGNGEVNSADAERQKTLQVVADAWANRLAELEHLLNNVELNPEQREILEAEHTFVEQQWQMVQTQLKNLLVKFKIQK